MQYNMQFNYYKFYYLHNKLANILRTAIIA